MLTQEKGDSTCEPKYVTNIPRSKEDDTTKTGQGITNRASLQRAWCKKFIKILMNNVR